MLIDGAETTPTEAKALERVWVLFDGADQAALTGARRLWTTLTARDWLRNTGQKKAADGRKRPRKLHE